MELKEIQALMHDFENSATRELKIDDGDFHLYLSKNTTNHDTKPVASTAATSNQVTSDNQASGPVAEDPQSQTITAPLVGTVYLQPKPDAKPYVQTGDHVEPGQVVCVIEAMKMITEIKSDVAGVITKINVENEELVEVEQPLFTVSKEG
ncbi:acetyl-CoA carboxylase biotin carboxyl carrier protein [Limosilactobacillus caecicola]|uniref:acetyl-CoA carboxylase biotin carboxyl carrier protein n=1 Tax=Limosilactobacillus caecicola TaxID=2941332 RepID=UPI00203DBB5B|nr:acetyl-CoA carboxylase biotin carboxyl carrier protein [Limosilactobacillus caecicola]